MNNFLDWFETKTATTIFAVIALIGGVSFLSYRLTGGIILNEGYLSDPLSLIGALLIICGIVLGVYTLKTR